MNKILKYGLCTIRNEEQGIVGWANMLNYFCDRVIALVDPATSDNTEELLKSNCPFVEIEYQDRNLGDSDYDIEGPNKSLIMHENKSKWVNNNIEDREWFIEIAADERFHPNDWEQMSYELLFAKKHGFDSIRHEQLLEPVAPSIEQIEFDGKYWYNTKIEKTNNIIENLFCIDWGHVRHCRFQQKKGEWIQNGVPHSDYCGQGQNSLFSSIPIWHFHRMKYNTPIACNWSDARGDISLKLKMNNNKLPLITRYCSFDWKTNQLISTKNRLINEMNFEFQYLNKQLKEKQWLLNKFKQDHVVWLKKWRKDKNLKDREPQLSDYGLD